MRRQRQLLLITLLLPVLLLGGLELLLRTVHVGAREPLFVPVADAPGYLQPNPAVLRRYFTDPRGAPEVFVDPTWFASSKAPGTLRIVVQGESSAAGFPYGHWASPAALLQQRLQRQYPGRDVEVIGTALAAATSNVLVDFADEIIAQHPDAVVIYAGHDEYFGLAGVGSSLTAEHSPTATKALALLSHLHAYRVLAQAVASLGTAPEPIRERDGTLLVRLAREHPIPLDSPLYRRGLAQYRGNLERLLRRYRAAGVQVFIGTLASNERDQPPFVSGAAGAGDLSAARHYERAQELEREGRYEGARREYRDARDRDELRLRAPEAFNDVIRECARANGARLVDVQTAFVDAARDGIVGNDLLLDHVHPDVEGYFRLATAFVPALTAWAGPAQVVVDDATARSELPVTELDRIVGEYRVAMLKNDWPFAAERRPTTFPPAATRIEGLAQAWFARQMSWADAMNGALNVYQGSGNLVEAARVAVNLADAFVTQPDVQYAAGRLLLRSGQAERSRRYLMRAVRLDGAPVEYPLALAEAQEQTGDRTAAVATLEGILAKHPAEERARKVLAELRARTGPAAAN